MANRPLLWNSSFLLAYVWGNPSQLLNPTDSQGKDKILSILISSLDEV